MLEHFFQCPYCWETISMLFDTSQNYSNYIEDCEVCCNPIQIDATFTANEVITFTSKSIEQ